MADGVRTWLQKTEKLVSPCARAARTASAVGGVVVSKPMAKNTTCRSGVSAAIRTASAADTTMRTSAPCALAFNRLSRPDPGTRSTSP